MTATTARAVAAMAIFLLATLPTSGIASSLRRGLDVVGCEPSGVLVGTSGDCNRNNNPDCCVDGQRYPQTRCSPPVMSFRKGKDGGHASECDGAYHGDSEMVVALSTGWFAAMSRCGKSIRITARDGTSALATVVDECDSVNGCDAEHNFEAPCGSNVVDASPAVWDALGLDQNDGVVDVTWSDQ